MKILKESWACWLADTLTWVYSLPYRLRLRLKRKHIVLRSLDRLTNLMYRIACNAVSRRERLLHSAAETATDIIAPLFTNNTQDCDGSDERTTG